MCRNLREFFGCLDGVVEIDFRRDGRSVLGVVVLEFVVLGESLFERGLEAFVREPGAQGPGVVAAASPGFSCSGTAWCFDGLFVVSKDSIIK